MDRPVVLLGPMGAGKSTLAPLLAQRLGALVRDTDDTVVARAGKPIPRIFAEEGEAGFRALEAQALTDLLEEPAVVAVGGGAVCRDGAWVDLVSAGAVTVRLEASPEVLAGRAAGGDRPLLQEAGDLAGRLAELGKERARWYARADLELDVSSGPPGALADALASLVREHLDRTVPVRLGRKSHCAHVVPGGLASLGTALGRRVPPEGARARLGLVSDDVVFPLYGDVVERSLTERGYEVTRVVFPAGEASKTLETASAVVDALLDAGIQRGSPLVALGGGVVGDLTGFVAAVLHRGGPVVQVPTTLLAMVDSSLGGKTGVNHRQGKNLIGAFHQPALIFADPATLGTLPQREYRAGLGEVVKYALLDDGGLFAALERDAKNVLAREPETLRRIIHTCLSQKARIVEADETEGGLRRLLNLGHTLGHALEAHTGYEVYLHGEAVALGLLAACRVGAARGACEASLEGRVASLLRRFGLPADPGPAFDPAVIARTAQDKKAAGTTVHFVVPLEGGGAQVTPLSQRELERLLTRRGEER